MNLEFSSLGSDKEWDDLMERWDSSSIYHKSGWIIAAERAFRWPCIRVVATERGQPVLAFPLFRVRFGPLAAVISPPPSLGMEFLGPVVTDEILTMVRNESRRLDLLTSALTYIQKEFRHSLSYVRLTPAFHDARAFKWAGYRVQVFYTYVLDLANGLESLFESFHPKVRGDIHRAEKRLEVRPGGKDVCANLHDFASERLRAQGLEFGPSRAYLLHLYDLLGPSRFQPLGAYTASGLEAAAIVTFDNRRAGLWQHVTAPNSSHLPLTTALVWHALKLAADRGCSELELVGADIPRLVAYKSKFGPALRQFYEASKASLPARSAVALYQRLRS